MQSLEGEVTEEGLRLRSMSVSEGAGVLHVRAVALGREGMPGIEVLEERGAVGQEPGMVRWTRRGVMEEYRVSSDGIRQDFLIGERLPGEGLARLEVEVSGATVEKAGAGLALVLDESGRRLAYHRLHVTDARGVELQARMERLGAGRLAVRLEDADAVYPVRIDPTFSDEDWVSMGTYPGANGPVYALALSGEGTLYVGGGFTIAGVNANYVAKWDGSAWSSLGGGLDGPVYALAADGAGNVYAGGAFWSAPSGNYVMVNFIAKWNGSTWSAMRNGMDAPVRALKLNSAGHLIAGGHFTRAGSTTVNYVARWDGSNWRAMGSGVGNSVFSLATVGTNVYVGGTFTTAGGIPANRIAKWNGVAWSALGTGVEGPGAWEQDIDDGYWYWYPAGEEDTVYALTTDGAGNVYAGGSFTNAGGVAANRVAKWNGSEWSTLGDGLEQGSVFTLCIDAAGNLFAGGMFGASGTDPMSRLAMWDGNVWSSVDSGMNGTVRALAADGAGAVYMGGMFTQAGSVRMNRVTKWEGGEFQALGSGNALDGAVHAFACDGPGTLYVGGEFTSVGNLTANYIAKWDGSAWSTLGSGVNSTVRALALDAFGFLYAAGDFGQAGGVPATKVAKWDGSAWSALGTGVACNVSAMTMDATGTLYVGGNLGYVSNGQWSNKGSVERWDGMAWSTLTSLFMGGGVVALAADEAGNVYAGGYQTNVGGSVVAKWNGSSWGSLGPGITNGSVSALMHDKSGNLYAGGNFTTVGGARIEGIAKWNGSTWSALGSGIGGNVSALAIDPSGNLYAGGYFTNAGSVGASSIAKWNGTAWSALGSGISNGTVNALSADDPERVYVGGYFSGAGGKDSSYMAYALISTQVPPAAPSALVVQETNSAGFRLAWNASEGATNYVLDVSFDAQFGSFLAGYNGFGTATAKQHEVTGLSAGSVVFCRVRAENANGFSGYSPVAMAVIPGVGGGNYFGTGSDGDVYINTTELLPVDVDGEMIVKNYRSLHIGPQGVLKPLNRNRGMLIYVQGDLTVEGEISMTARGASGSPDAFGVAAEGIRIVRQAPGGTSVYSRSELSGAGMNAVMAEASQAPVLSEARAFRVARQGAAGGTGVTSSGGNAAGNPGYAGTNQTGGGGSGGGRNSGSASGSGSYGSCFSGGSGGSANYSAQGGGISAAPWGGAGGNSPFTGSSYDRSIGGGAGNPGGQGLQSAGLTTNAPYAGEDGTGGLLILVVQGDVTVSAGGRITANGVKGGLGTLTYERSGGCSGGGAILLMHAGSLNNQGVIEAVGGVNPSNTSAGGRGGAGWVDVAQIYPPDNLIDLAGQVVRAGTGAGVAGVAVSYSDDTRVSSGNTGWYVKRVEPGWSGTAMPPTNGIWRFMPERRDYADVAAHHRQEHFVMGSTNHWYSRLITVTNSGVVELTNFQVRVVLDTKTAIENGRMRADGADIRFMDEAGVTPVSYWIEPETLNRTNTQIWIKAPLLPANRATRFSLFYGKSNSVAASDGEATFDFFDDFSRVDTNKFSYGESYAGVAAIPYEVKDGLLREWSDGSYKGLRMKREFGPQDRILTECKFMASGNSAWHQNYLVQAGNVDRNRFGMQANDAMGWRMQHRVDGGSWQNSGTLSELSSHVWYISRIEKRSDTTMGAVITELDYTPRAQYSTTAAGWADETWTWFNMTYHATSLYYDWVRVRQYAAVDPVVTVGTEEQTGLAVTIAGRVTDSVTGNGVAGVVFEGANVLRGVSDAQGYYVLQALAGWSGSVSPVYGCGTFMPATRAYSHVFTPYVEQNYEVQGLTPPLPFSLSSPADGAVVRDEAVLEWEAIPCVSEYDVYVGVQNAQPRRLATVQTNVYRFTLPAAGTYSWYVLARNSVGSSRAPAVETWTFQGFPRGTPDGSLYRIPLLISNSTSVTLTDYQVKCSLPHQSEMFPNFSNIFFTDEGGGERLSFWMESFEAGAKAEVWIKVPSLPPNSVTRIYLCYGSTTAEPAGNGDDTFLFFDDFSGSALKAGWTFWNPGGNDTYSLTERPGWMRIKVIGISDTWSAVNQAPFMYMTLPDGADYAVEARTDAIGVASSRSQFLAWIRSFATGTANKGYVGAFQAPMTIKYEADGFNGATFTATSAVHHVRYRRVGATIFYDASNDGNTWVAMGNHAPGSVPLYWGVGSKTWSSTTNHNADFDHYFVRRYAGSDPTVQYGMTEEMTRISGQIVYGETGAAVPGVFLKLGDEHRIQTGSDGRYNGFVPRGWSGTIEPLYACGVFTPAERNVANLNENLVGQDFVLDGVNPPPSFALMEPAEGAAAMGEARMTWEAIECAEEYDVYVGREGSSPALVAAVRTNAYVFAVPTNGTYLWHVMARNVAGSSRAPETGGRSFTGYPRVWISGDLTIGEQDFGYDDKALVKVGGTLTVNGSHRFAELILTNGAQLTHVAATATNAPRLDLNILGMLRVASNCAINVSGKGYLAGRTHPNTTTNASTGQSGGSYGGLGGAHGGIPNPVYGDLLNPNEPGSGGNNGPGGGLLRMTASSLELYGTITANGTDGDYGRGSGGGIYLDVGTILGTGLISARGGNSSGYQRGGGGGGRVAIYYQEAGGYDFGSRVSALGGTGAVAGAPGTVHVANSAPVRVSQMTPTGRLRGPVGSVDLVFIARLDDTTFGLDDLSLTGPQGAVALSGLSPLDSISYRLSLSQPVTAEGVYTLSLRTEIWTYAGQPPEGGYTNHFVIDFTSPSAPVVTNWVMAPATNELRSTTATLWGTREADSAVWINGTQQVARGTGVWSKAWTFAQGVTTLRMHAVDQAGNVSSTNECHFAVDSIAPAVTNIVPKHNAVTSAPPPTVRLFVLEAGSGLNAARSSWAVKKTGVTVPGGWNWASGVLTFTPQESLLDGAYAVSATLVDGAGNTGTFASVFTVDTVAPEVPVVAPVVSPTMVSVQSITGYRDAGAQVRVYRSGAVVSTLAASGNFWSYTASLGEGENWYEFSAVDAAGNESARTNVFIRYGNQPPGPVVLTAAVHGVGTVLTLGWAGYDEVTNGADIAYYKIYRHTAPFSLASEAQLIGTNAAGKKSYVVSGLTRGATQHYAVVARDLTGLEMAALTSYPFAPVDTVAPPAPTGMVFVSGSTDLQISWPAVNNPDGDLAGYRLYPTNMQASLTFEATNRFYMQSGLAPAVGYVFRLTSFDMSGNESAGLVNTGYTRLANPTGLTVVPFDGYAELSWQAATPASALSHYAVYAATSHYTDVAGMARRLTTTNTQTLLAGFVNGVTHYVAVTAVNKSSGEETGVSPVATVTGTDSEGPELIRWNWNGAALNPPVAWPGTLSVTCRDPSGMSRVEFRVNGELIGSDIHASTNFSTLWDVSRTPSDGVYSVEARGYDTRGNVSVWSTNISVALSVPGMPVIVSPLGTSTVSRLTQSVIGTGALHAAEAAYFINGTSVWTNVVSAAGTFSAELPLQQGANVIRVGAINRAGIGALSKPVTVVADQTLPSPPVALTAEAQADGVIRLAWSEPAGVSVQGYHVYRTSLLLGQTGPVVRVNGSLVTARSYSDLPNMDGEYAYRVSSVNSAGVEGEWSAPVALVSDRIAPRVLSVEYESNGIADVQAKRFGLGMVTVYVNVSEPLQAGVFFSLNPAGGTPISLALSAVSELRYRGTFTVAADSPCGLAYAVFSGRDRAGNRGTEIQAGSVITLDVCGPVLKALTLTPSDPIENGAGGATTVAVVAEYDVEDVPVATPELRWTLSTTRTTETTVALAPLTSRSWMGSLTLPAGAGIPAEMLRFSYAGVDSFGNTGRVIQSKSSAQVYQGDLPPCDAPSGLTGKALSEGRVLLRWGVVELATNYTVWKGMSAGDLAPIGQSQGMTEYVAQGGNSTSWYAVASVRAANGRTATSAVSEAVCVVSDAQPPAAPTEVRLALQGASLLLSWQPPPDDTVRFDIYRHTLPFTAVETLTPRATNIPIGLWLDSSAISGPAYYGVVSVDQAGNVSGPSALAYTNLSLLPVSSLSVQREEEGLPRLFWTHRQAAGIDGYKVYEGAAGLEQLVKSGLAPSSTSYVDTAYTSGSRGYGVTATDWLEGREQESAMRRILLPDATVELPVPALVKRRVMNRLQMAVSNRGEVALSAARLFVQLQGVDHASEPFSLAPGASTNIPVVVGGYTNLPSVAPVTLRVEVEPIAGDKAVLIRRREVAVGTGMLLADILNDELTRGVPGKVRFAVQNTSDEEVQIVLAKSSGQLASPEVRIRLMNTDGMIYGTVSPRQALGNWVETLASGTTVARIPAGERFVSSDITVNIPTNAASTLVLQLEVDKIHYRLGEPEHVEISGLQSTRSIELADTRYTTAVTNVTPSVSLGATNIVLQGWAWNRATGLPEPHAAVQLVISVDGFERSATLYTDSNGQWRHVFIPLDNEDGLYTAWATHPSVVAKPQQAEFRIMRVGIWPSPARVSIPRHYTQSVPIKITPSRGTTLSNVTVTCTVAEQPGGVMPEGVTLTLPTAAHVIKGGTSVTLPFTVRGDDAAPASCQLLLRVKGDGAPTNGWGEVPVELTFQNSAPTLSWTPNYVNAGVAVSNVALQTITLRNTGFADLAGVTLALLATNGAPAPAWVRLNAPSNLGTIAMSGERAVSLTIAPTGGVSEGQYQFILRVAADNHPARTINLFVGVDGSGQGRALFKVSDIYTGTPAAQGGVVQGMSGGQISLQKESGTLLVTNLTTDALGEALFERLPVGAYLVKITASQHETYSGRIWVQPGATTVKEVFLPYNLVTVEWKVTPVVLEDRYEVVLTTTFKTDVPAPVVVIEPTSITLPEMQPGDVFKGELKFTNYGLLRADDVQFEVPYGGDYYRFELLRDVPASIDAKQVIRIPYQVVRLGTIGDSGGGTPCAQMNCGRLTFHAVCANGQLFAWESKFCVVSYENCSAATPGASGASGTATGGAGSFGVSGSSYGNSSISGAPASLPQTTLSCEEEAQSPDHCVGEDCGTQPEPSCDAKIPANSVVSVNRGDYEDQAVDLYVKVAGGYVNVQRTYDDYRWTFDDLEPAGEFFVSIPETNKSVQYVGQAYCYAIVNDTDYEGFVQLNGDAHSVTQGLLFAHDGKRLERRGSNWEVFSPDGWSKYSAKGRLLEYGEEHGPKTRLLYGSEDRVVGIQDHFSNQVLWVEHVLVNGTQKVSQVRDVRHRTVTYAYDPDGNLTNVTDVAGYRTRYAYDSNHRLTSKTLPSGQRIDIEYSDEGTVRRVGDKQYQHRYDSASGEYYVSRLHPDGRLEEFWYDSSGALRRSLLNGSLVSAASNSLSATWPKYTYNDQRQVTRMDYENGKSALFEYNGQNNQLSRKVDQRGLVTLYEYDLKGRRIREIAAAGTVFEKEVVYTYDDLGQKLTETWVGKNGKPDQQWRQTYDSAGNILTTTDSLGNVLSNRYDNLGNLIRQVNPDGHVIDYDYDVRGLLTGVRDTQGLLQSNRYDAAENRIWNQDALGRITTWTYNTAGQLLALTNAAGEATRWEYDIAGRITKRRDFNGKETTYSYDAKGGLIVPASGIVEEKDAAGRVVRMTYPSGEVYRYGYESASGMLTNIVSSEGTSTILYDARNRPVTILFNNGSRVETHRWSYDEYGQILWSQNADGGEDRYAYDLLGRVQHRVNPLGYTNHYQYNELGEIGQVSDAYGRLTRFEYDATNQQYRTILANGGTFLTKYDWANRVSSSTDAMGHTMKARYDGRGHLVESRFYATPGSASPEMTFWYSYDAAGRTTNYGTTGFSTRIEYGDSNRTKRVTTQLGSFTKTYEYGYDEEGRKISFTGPSGGMQRYTYGTNNELASVQVDGLGFIRFLSDAQSRSNAILYPGGIRQEILKDADGHVTANRAVDAAGQTLVRQAIQRDVMERIAALETETGTRQYGYDLLGRLTSAENPTGAEEQYTYDDHGNRKTSAAQSGEWSCDVMDRLNAWPGGSYGFNANGQVTQRVVNGSVQYYAYDLDDRLTTVRDADQQLIARYQYDTEGRRISKEVNGTVVWYLYSEEGLIGEYDSAGEAIREYGYRPDGTWMMNPLFVKQTNTYSYFMNDHLGAPNVMVSAAGRVVWSAAQDAFGKATVDPASTLENPLRMSGQYYDEETGLHYNTFRYYDPETGRYLMPDPLGYADGMNTYLFCANDPINAFDPWGLNRHTPKDRCQIKLIDCNQLNEDLIRAQLAGAAYLGGQLPIGWEPMQPPDGEWSDPETGFAASVFREKSTGRYVLAFRGSDDKQDWTEKGNFGQGKQYAQAVEFALKCKDKYPNLEIVGHSLGGGLASLAAGVAGLPATTFNAAGLWNDTAKNYGTTRKEAKKYIHAYIVDWEVLDTAQSVVRTPVAVAVGGVPAIVEQVAKSRLFRWIPGVRSVGKAAENLTPSLIDPFEGINALACQKTRLSMPPGYQGPLSNMGDRHLMPAMYAAIEHEKVRQKCIPPPEAEVH